MGTPTKKETKWNKSLEKETKSYKTEQKLMKLTLDEANINQK